MDFFERWLSFSPDGGDGTAEVAYIAIMVGVFLTFLFRHQILALIRAQGQSPRASLLGGGSPEDGPRLSDPRD
jgi:hypothetical protein